ncbi:MAG: carotenoid oxygenase family protein, partial [Tumebacillaceae bacterium]
MNERNQTTPTFQLGFQNLMQEVNVSSLPVQGTIPAWLTGNLFRNGPALFSLEGGAKTHWFDGLAMIHKFAFQDGRVAYSNRFLRTDAFKKAMETGQLGGAFGNSGGGKIGGVNPNVHIAEIADRLVAMTEAPAFVEFDAHSLHT